MKNRFVALLLLLTVAFSFAGAATPAYAADPTDAAKSQVCTGVSGQAGGTCGTGGVDIGKVITGVLNLLSIIAGVAAVIMIMISGLKYITSQGEAQAVSSSKRTLIYAIVGVVVVAMSQIIVHFVLAKLNGK